MNAAAPVVLTFADVKAVLGRHTFQKGLEDFKAGRVLHAAWNQWHTDIQSEVQGAGETVYQQDITVLAGREHWEINDYCSCPLGGGCKHVAAVLISLTEQAKIQRQQPDPKLQYWLSQVAEQPAAQPQLATHQDHLLVELYVNERGVFAQLKRARRGRKGQFLQGSRLALHDLEFANAWWASPDEQAALKMLHALRGGRQDHIYLQGQLGYLVLSQLLAKHQVFWQGQRKPLQLHAKSQLAELRWLQQSRAPAESSIEPTALTNSAQGYQVQLHFADVSEPIVIGCEPPLVLDVEQGLVFPVASPLSGGQLWLVSQMPAVAVSDLPAVVEQLVRHFPAEHMPMPPGFTDTLLVAPLVPKLRLTMLSLPRGKRMPIIELAWQYGQLELPGLLSEQNLMALSANVTTNTDTALTALHSTKPRWLRRDGAAELLAYQLLFTVAEPYSAQADDLEFGQTQYFQLGLWPDSHEQWCQFVEQQLPELSQRGWHCEVADDFDLQLAQGQLVANIAELGEDQGWFGLSLHADIDGQRVPLLPLLAQWLKLNGSPNDDDMVRLQVASGQWLRVKARSIKPILRVLTELFSDKPVTEQLQLPSFRAAMLHDLQDADIRLLNAKRSLQLSKQLNDFNGITAVETPALTGATLRPYQQAGLNWLTFLQRYRLGGILADDMGLGKTLQTLALFAHLQQHGLLVAGALVVCPTSLVGNWHNEAKRFTPQLKVVCCYGPDREAQLQQMAGADVIVTTYPLFSRDAQHYLMRGFSAVVLDEAQHIKNPQSKISQQLKNLQAPFKLCLTGTPVENHLGELKSLFDFALPGLLGSQRQFQQQFAFPISRFNDQAALAELKQRVAPFMLRRTKAEVMAELPEKTEIDQVLELEQDQRNLYETIRVTMEQKVRDLFTRKGAAQSQIEVLDALLKLRQACCDPRLVALTEAKKVRSNAKLAWLQDNLPEMVSEGRKVIIFSQFASMLNLLAEQLREWQLPFSLLTGQTVARQQQIDAFQQGEVPVFLVSLKAGGTGLNLTAADTVIHFDPWWNPATQAQATDRAHRMGQDKPVFVYRLLTKNTVEEKILQMQGSKQALADAILSGASAGQWQGSAEQLLALFQ